MINARPHELFKNGKSINFITSKNKIKIINNQSMNPYINDEK